MKAEVKKKWIADLRSGEFKQSSGMLVEGTKGQSLLGVPRDVPPVGYCCLGVLATQSPDGVWGYPGDSVFEGEKFGTLDCMTWNDDDKLTFEQIADKIESLSFNVPARAL